MMVFTSTVSPDGAASATPCDDDDLSPLFLALLALDLSGAAHDLARSVANAVAHEPVVLSVRNLSTLGPGESAEIQQAFESELKTAGTASAEVALTISENLTQYILLAEIERGGTRQVLLESWARSAANSTAARPDSGRVTLEKKLLWEQDQPILDAVETGDATLVLDGARVLLVRAGTEQSMPVTTGQAWPRDLRGRLSVNGSAFTVWLPGTVCRGSIAPQLTLECGESQDAWLLGPAAIAVFAPARNFFTGHIDVEPGGARDVPPFYSAAPDGDAWILAGTDGRARIYTHAWEAAGNIDQWGSDIAGIQTPCGARILATRPTGLAEPDAIQPYELIGNAASPAGPAVEFAGPVTALWSAGKAATAVSRDLETGRYAAFTLAPACGS